MTLNTFESRPSEEGLRWNPQRRTISASLGDSPCETVNWVIVMTIFESTFDMSRLVFVISDPAFPRMVEKATSIHPLIIGRWWSSDRPNQRLRFRVEPEEAHVENVDS